MASVKWVILVVFSGLTLLVANSNLPRMEKSNLQRTEVVDKIIFKAIDRALEEKHPRAVLENFPRVESQIHKQSGKHCRDVVTEMVIKSSAASVLPIDVEASTRDFENLVLQILTKECIEQAYASSVARWY